MSNKLNFSEISLNKDEIKLLRSFAEHDVKDYDSSALPLMDLGLLEVRYIPFKKGSNATVPKAGITHRGQLYLKYLSKKRGDRFLIIGTFVASVLAVIISLLK